MAMLKCLFLLVRLNVMLTVQDPYIHIQEFHNPTNTFIAFAFYLIWTFAIKHFAQPMIRHVFSSRSLQEMHGKPSIDELIAKCPTDLKYFGIDLAPKVVFGDSVFVEVAFSSSHRQEESVSFVVVHRQIHKIFSHFFGAFGGNIPLLGVEKTLGKLQPLFSCSSKIFWIPLPTVILGRVACEDEQIPKNTMSRMTFDTKVYKLVER